MVQNLATPSVGRRVLDVDRIRADFPILQTTSNGRPLVYLDNGATTQKPRAVIDRLVRYYETENANIHRGVYDLSQRATQAYEDARHTVAGFIGAADHREIIFTRGTTEAINLVASSFARSILQSGDQIILSSLEHHSNIVPWQMIADAMGATIYVIPMNDAGELLLDEYEKLLSPRTKIVAVNHISNALGTINDVERIVRRAHLVGAKVLIDGAQWIAHHPTNVGAIGCDFYCFSGHKVFGPTGIGVLWGRRELLEAMPPYQGGGDMIESVTFARTTYAGLPNKFEAGTPNIAGAAGLAAAIEYVQAIGFDQIVPHEQRLLDHATRRLGEIDGLRIIGTAAKKAGVFSFVIDDPTMSPLDIGLRLDQQGIAVRTGHHCCQPIMDRLGLSATTRASVAMYNTLEEIDALADALSAIIAGESRKTQRRKTVDPAASVNGAASVNPAASLASDADLPFAHASAASPQQAADELADNFEMLPDRDARSEYVIDLGNELPHTFDRLKQLTARIPGCMSEVHLLTRFAPASAGDALEFVADANADIVRGLIAILQRIYSGQSARQVLEFDIESFFRRIGLDQFITSQRRNGLAGMIDRIRSGAQSIAHETARS